MGPDGKVQVLGGAGRFVDARRQALNDRVSEAIQRLRSPDWCHDPSQQLDVVRLVRLLEGSEACPVTVDVMAQLTREARLAFAKLPGQSAARFDTIVKLPSEEDVARALAYQPRSSSRYPGEEVYPTDGWLGEYLRWCQEGEVPLGWHFWAGVAALSAACHRHIFMDRGSFFLYPVHSIFLTGPSGLRKTQALDTALAVIEAANRQISEEWKHDLRTRFSVMQDFDPRIRLLPNDANFLSLLLTLKGQTTAPLGDESVNFPTELDSCGLLALGELGTFLSKDGFAVGKTIDTLISLCDAPRQYRYTTVRQGSLILNNVALTVLACTTPHWLRENMTARMFLGGLASRILFIHRSSAGGRCYSTPASLDPVARETLGAWLALLGRRPKTPMRLSPDADRRFDEWYRDNHTRLDSGTLDERLGGYFRRKDGHVLRLAMILALTYEETREVSLERFEQALRIIDHEETPMLECFAEVARHPDAPLIHLIVQHVRRVGMIQHSDLLRRCHHFEGIGKRFPELLDMAIAMRYIVKAPPSEGRRGVWYMPLFEAGPGTPGTPRDLD